MDIFVVVDKSEYNGFKKENISTGFRLLMAQIESQ